MLEQTKWAKRMLKECGVKSCSVTSSLSTHTTHIVIFDRLDEQVQLAPKLAEHFSISIGLSFSRPIVMLVRLPGREQIAEHVWIDWRKGIEYWDIKYKEAK